MAVNSKGVQGSGFHCGHIHDYANDRGLDLLSFQVRGEAKDVKVWHILATLLRGVFLKIHIFSFMCVSVDLHVRMYAWYLWRSERVC